MSRSSTPSRPGVPLLTTRRAGAGGAGAAALMPGCSRQLPGRLAREIEYEGLRDFYGGFSVSSKFRGTILQSLDSRPSFAPDSKPSEGKGWASTEGAGLQGGSEDGPVRTSEGQGGWTGVMSGVRAEPSSGVALR